jgi:hypothetical protein
MFLKSKIEKSYKIIIIIINVGGLPPQVAQPHPFTESLKQGGGSIPALLHEGHAKGGSYELS